MFQHTPCDGRLIIRSVSDFTVRSGVIHARAFDHDDVNALIVLVTYSGNTAHLSPADPASLSVLPGRMACSAALRPVSVRSVSASVGMAYETIRERIEGLCKIGILQHATGGVRLSDAGLASANWVRSWIEVHQQFLAMLRQIAALGLDVSAIARLPVARAEITPPSPLVVTRLVIDFEARLLGNLAPTFGSILRAHVWSAVLAYNLKHLLTDRVAARRHATIEQEPDSARRPVSVRKVALHLEQPYETTRRHIVALAAAGAVRQSEMGGYYVPRPPAPNPPLDSYNEKLLINFSRLMNELHRVGFSPFMASSGPRQTSEA